MATLRAVNPQRSGVVDLDGVGGDHASGLRGRDGHVAGVEASHVGHDAVDGLARLVKGRLGHGVVAGNELELNHVACSGLDVVGRVDQGVVGGADRNDLHLLCYWESVSTLFLDSHDNCPLLVLSCCATSPNIPFPRPGYSLLLNVPEAKLAKKARAAAVNCILILCSFF